MSFGFLEGRAYTIGRDGHIRIDDPALSRGHAEIKFTGGRILLRDLGSTNGTYLISDNDAIEIDLAYVSPNQRVAMGSAQYSIKELLAMVGIYASYTERTGLVVKLASPVKKPVAEKS